MNSEGQGKKTLLCAIYTRKSTDENLDQKFNSLDSQREYCQSFIKTREPQGWQVCKQDYSDPGFSGGDMDRPALQRLLRDARKRKFQVVVCYKYDRLSRNTGHFLHMLEVFEKYGIAFASVTQPIDTSSSAGRLMRSILMDFAQFEREMISERTRDKLAAMARKGMRTGSCPQLGYDIDKDKRAVVNQEEAEVVQFIFRTYLKLKSVRAVVKLLNAKWHKRKSWTGRDGTRKGGAPYTKANLLYMLKNPFFIGKLRYREHVFKGLHEAIIDEGTFADVQKYLERNFAIKKSLNRNKHHFLLKGLVRCAACDSIMTPNFAYSHTGERYFYYKCSSVNKMDKTACPVRSVPAKELDGFVVRKLSALGKDKAFVEEIVQQAHKVPGQKLNAKRKEKQNLASELGRLKVQRGNVLDYLGQHKPGLESKAFVDRLSVLSQRDEEIEAKLKQLDVEILALENQQIEADLFR
ncbi:MAG: recombinase family protein, partial [Desulfobaccales bacterium]